MPALGIVPILLALVGAAATAAPMVMEMEAGRKASSAERAALKRALAEQNALEGEALLRELRGYGISPHIDPRNMSMADLEWLRGTARQVRGLMWRKRILYLVLGAAGAGVVWFAVGRAA